MTHGVYIGDQNLTESERKREREREKKRERRERVLVLTFMAFRTESIHVRNAPL